jgi:hypothetical protein
MSTEPGALGSRPRAIALVALTVLAWLLRAFVTPAAPFHENFHGYSALALDPFSVPGEPSLTSSFLGAARALGLQGDRLLAANQVISALTVAPAMLLAQDLLGGVPGLLTGVLVATHPLLVRLGASESPFAFYTLALLLSLVAGRSAARRESAPGFAAAALLASVAVFAREFTVAAAVVFALVTGGLLPTGRRALYVALLMLPFGAAALRVVTMKSLGDGPPFLLNPAILDPAGRLLMTAWSASFGALTLLRTPAAFPWLAVAGLGLLLARAPRRAGLLVLVLGALQVPFAVSISLAATPLSGARHLSPALPFWAMLAALPLATGAGWLGRRLPARLAPLAPVLAVLALLAALPDAWSLAARRTLTDREYPVLRQCLERLPDEARYVVVDGGPTEMHVSRMHPWLRAERPDWAPLDEAVLAFDARRDRRVPVVLLIDHACTAPVSMTGEPDGRAAREPTPWGPLAPACARAFEGRAWQTVVREDLRSDVDADGVGGRIYPVGCLVEVSAGSPYTTAATWRPRGR